MSKPLSRAAFTCALHYIHFFHYNMIWLKWKANLLNHFIEHWQRQLIYLKTDVYVAQPISMEMGCGLKESPTCVKPISSDLARFF